MTATILAFGPFRLDAEAGILLRGSEPIALGQRAVALLRVLLHQPGMVVSKDALIEAAWPGLAVEDSNLTVQIAALRRALGAEPGGQRWIETLPRRGYRFIGPDVAAVGPLAAVAEVDAASPASVPPPRADTKTPDKPSIAVLPFTNMSGDPEQEHFADGLTEDIITALSQLHGIAVVARNSSFVYKGRPVAIRQVGADLNVRYVLEGSVRRHDGSLRITGQLVDAEIDEHVWADRYDRQGADLFAVQDDIARRFVSAIERVVRRRETDRASGAPAGAAAEAQSPLSAADAERRQLTVLACELIAPPSQASGIDLEDLGQAIDAYQLLVAETVRRFDGVVATRIGKTVLVNFGFPVTHEDDAEKAVRAGLALCAAAAAAKPAAGIALQCRVGIATGQVIVGELLRASDGEERRIIGEVPSFASRLQAAARPATLVIDDTTRQLVGKLFEYRDLGSIGSAGPGEAMRSWQVLQQSAIESRFEALRSPTLSPLVGRDEEMQLLQRRWQQAAQGAGRVVLIVGEAGIGKSRMAAALQDHLRIDRHDRIRYFCSPFHRDRTLYPILRHLERAARFAVADTPECKLEKLAALLTPARPADGDVALLAEAMGLPGSARYPRLELSPQRKKERTLGALFRQLEFRVAQQPLLMLLEDLHWIDPTTQETLDLLIERIERFPMLLVLTCRPEQQLPWIGLPQVTVVALNRLGGGDAAMLAQHVAGHAEPLAPPLVDEIVARSGGVPLFIEELTKSALETTPDRALATNVPAVPSSPAVPVMLHAPLMARLDRLGADARQIAQIGAAVGREFSLALVEAAGPLAAAHAEKGVKLLLDSGFVFRRGAPPGETFIFKHALLQDVAYGTLLRQARRDLHGRIAIALETQFPERAASEPELVARHLIEAGLPARAAAYLLRAGRLALQRSALLEAERHLERGLEVLRDVPKEIERTRLEIDLYLGLGAARWAAKGPAALGVAEAYGRARSLSEEIGDPGKLYTALIGLYAHQFYVADRRAALQTSEEILRLARGRNDREASLLMGWVLYQLGNFERAEQHVRQSLVPGKSVAPRRLEGAMQDGPVTALASHGLLLYQLGYLEQADARKNAALERARALSHPYTLAFALAVICQAHWFSRDKAALAEHARELVELSTEQGYSVFRPVGLIHTGWAMVESGRAAEGIVQIENGIAAFRDTGTMWGTPYHLGLLACSYGALGQPKRGLGLIEEALDAVRRIEERWFEAELGRIKGELHCAMCQETEAEAAFTEAAAVARDQRAKLCELRACMSHAALRLKRGEKEAARELLAPVCAWFTEGLDTPQIKEAMELLERLSGPPARRRKGKRR